MEAVTLTPRQRWLAYKVVLERELQELIKSLRFENLWTLKRHLMAKYPVSDMKSEFAFCNIDADSKKKDALSNFVKCLIFRPDVSCAVQQLLHDELHLTIAASVLGKAINAAKWTEDFWSKASSLPEKEEEELPGWIRAVRSTGDALTGVATVSLTDLQNQCIVSGESAARIKEFSEFSEQRGVKLTAALIAVDWQSVRSTFASNRFLQLVLREACDGKWCGPIEHSYEPPIPDHYILRANLVNEALAALLAAIRSPHQQWIVICGAERTGKTCLAIDLAHRNLAARVVWLRFGERDKADIYAEARTIVLDSFPDADRTLLSPKSCLSQTLTREATKGVVLFLDDVCRTDLLETFAKAKTVVITSRKCIKYHRVKDVANVSVPPSLTMEESLQVFGKIVKREISPFMDLLKEIFESLRFNVHKISALASYLEVQHNEWDNDFLQEMLHRIAKDREEEFEIILEALESSGHDYSDFGT